MKRILHHLRFEWSQWWKLLVVLWAGIAACTGLVAGIARVTAYEDPSLSMLRTANNYSMLVVAVCFVSLPLLAGGGGSPVTGAGWLMTRPIRRFPLLAARGLLLLAGAALPLSAGYAVILTVLEFNSATVFNHLFQCMGVSGAMVLALMLWSAAGLNYSGALAGTIVIGVTGMIFILTHSSNPALNVRYPWTHPLLLFLLALVHCTVRIRKAQKQGMVSGLVAGLIAAGLITLLPVLENLTERRLQKENEEAVFGPNAGDWELKMTGKPTVETEWGGQLAWRILLEAPDFPDHFAASNSRVVAVSARDSLTVEWDEWPAVYGELDTGVDTQWHAEAWRLTLRNPRKSPYRLNDGELRVKVRGSLLRQEIRSVPLKNGAFVQGENWMYRIGEVELKERGSISFQGVGRSAGAWPPEANPFIRSNSRVRADSVGTNNCFILGNVPAVFLRFAGAARDKSVSDSVPTELMVRHISATSSCERTIHVRAVTLNPPGTEVNRQPIRVRAVPDAGEKPEARPVHPPSPWTKASPPQVPTEPATDSDVAVYLTIAANWMDPPRGHGTAENKAKLGALVPGHLPLFLEAVRFQGDEKVFTDALVAGAPEERRDQVLSKLGEIPKLVEVVVVRGWEEAAKPHVLTAVQSKGFIPPGWEALCRSYRDAAFHAAMQKRFTADVATVKYWESMPDLAEKLPAQLAEVSEFIRRQPHVSSWTEELERQMHALMYSGDAKTLDYLLHDFRNNKDRASWSGGLLSWRVRTSDGQRVDNYDKSFQPFIGDSTAADYRFDPVRRYFVRKSLTSRP